jgi:hypothetical protein
MRPQKRQVAVLGRAHTKSQLSERDLVEDRGPAEWTGDRIQSRFATLAKLAGSAQSVAGSARRLGGARAPGSSARRQGGCKFNAIASDGRPQKIALFADGLNTFQPTVDPKQSVSVKAMGLYGTPKV